MTETLTAVDFKTLSHWNTTDLSTSLQAFQRSALEMLNIASGFRRQAAYGGTLVHWRNACEQALKAKDATQFFEDNFKALRVSDPDRPEGLFTGYYEPIVHGSRKPDPRFPVPVYAKPSDLVTFNEAESKALGLAYGRRINNQPQPYLTRDVIETRGLADQAEIICWLSDWVDAFFMHVQGQGRVSFEDGSVLRLSYAGKTGHPYTGIGHVLVEQGLIPKAQMSMQTLRAWMQQNPENARPLMWQNKSYIFFQATDVKDAALGGIGAAKVNLTPLYSLAVDRAYWMFGTPFWIETSLPPEFPNQNPALNRLMIAQDTGSAIKGKIRGDFFWGWGEDAETIAGHMKSAGAMTALLPKPLAEVLAGAP
jgi:membrane-bound lytic murein transglycosylase A